MGSRLLFIQGLVAWLSVCLLLTVIWDRNHREEAPAAHEFAALPKTSTSVTVPQLGVQPQNTEEFEQKHEPTKSTLPLSPQKQSNLAANVDSGASSKSSKKKLPRHQPSSSFPKRMMEGKSKENEKLVKMLDTLDDRVPASHSVDSTATSAGGIAAADTQSSNSGGKSSSSGSDNERGHPLVPWLPDAALERTVDNEKRFVYMDWGRGNLAFTLANYRSLESVLAHHPNAEVKNQ
jgi:hypothetical protein